MNAQRGSLQEALKEQLRQLFEVISDGNGNYLLSDSVGARALLKEPSETDLRIYVGDSSTFPPEVYMSFIAQDIESLIASGSAKRVARMEVRQQDGVIVLEDGLFLRGNAGRPDTGRLGRRHPA